MKSNSGLKVLSTDSSKAFRCIGADCESTCCKNWHIEVDKNTYVRYSRIQDKDIRKILNRSLVVNQDSKNDENYADMSLDEEKKCPLYKTGLCRLQAELGEEYLSNVCYTYPRYTNIIDGVMECSLTVSCPEAARKILMDRGSISFSNSEVPGDYRYILFNRVDTKELSKNNPAYLFFHEIRSLSISILQAQNYTLSDRLIILGLFLSRISQQEYNAVYTSNIKSILDSFVSLIQSSASSLFSDIPSDNSIQLKLLSEIVKERLAQAGLTDEYKECLLEMLKGLEYSLEVDTSNVLEQYKCAYKDHFEPYFNSNSIVFENYLVNYAFKNIFPFDRSADLLENYMMMVIHLALIKLHLIGMSAFHGRIDDAMVVRLIFNLSRTIEHNNVYLEYIKELLNSNQLNTLPYMAILVKN